MSYRELLRSPDWVAEGLRTGRYTINYVANRIIDSSDKKFIAALVPGSGLAELPAHPAQVAKLIQTTESLQKIAPLLAGMKLMGTVGAAASVATLGVCCVGFGVVLHRLNHINAKLDQTLDSIQAIKAVIEETERKQEDRWEARIESAKECLERALKASQASTRRELAEQAGKVFQDARNAEVRIWSRTRPLDDPSVHLEVARGLQNRFAAAALGELQANFIRGDIGVFRQAARQISEQFSREYVFEGAEILRRRSDLACGSKFETFQRFAATLPELTAELDQTAQIADWTYQRLAAAEEDADLPEQLSLEPHEIVDVAREASGLNIYVLTPRLAA